MLFAFNRLIIAERPVSSISTLFRTRLSSTIYKDIYMYRNAGGLGQPSNNFWPSLGKYRVG